MSPGGDPDRLRALQTLGGSTTGYTVTAMMEHGFALDMLTEVVSSGLARATRGDIAGCQAADRVTWLTITTARRKALADT